MRHPLGGTRTLFQPRAIDHHGGHNAMRLTTDSPRARPKYRSRYNLLCASHTASDPVTISPQYYTVLLDSNHVRVLEYRLAPGQRETIMSTPTTSSTSSNRPSCERLIPMVTVRKRSSRLGRHCIAKLCHTRSRTSATRKYMRSSSNLGRVPRQHLSRASTGSGKRGRSFQPVPCERAAASPLRRFRSPRG